MTIFSKIISREIPADIVYEDEHCLAFRDVNAQAPLHVLVIPKRVIPSLVEVDSSDATLLGHLLVTASQLAPKLGYANGFRTVINCGSDGGQTVNHLHVHLLAGRHLGWPPG